MKKIFSLICALAIVLSASAVPVQPKEKAFIKNQKVEQLKREKKASSVTNKEARKASKRSAQAVQFKAAKTASLEKGARVKTERVNAPQAKQANYSPTVTKVIFDYYVEDSDVYYEIYTADYVFTFDILLASGEDVVSGQTYTFADMDDYYSCQWTLDGDWIADYTAATFKKTVAADGSYTIEATATTEDGDTYTLNASVSAYVPQTFNVTITDVSFKFYASYGDAYYVLSDANEDYKFYFDIFVAAGLTDVELGKTYTLADMDATYSKGIDYVLYTNVAYASATFTKTINIEGLVNITAQVVSSKGDTYNLVYQEEPIALSGDTVIHTIAGNAKLTYSSYFEDWTIKADDGTYGMVLDIYSDNATSAVGTYSKADFDLDYTTIEVYTTPDSSSVYKAVDASAVISENADGSIAINASLIGDNGTVYIFSASYSAPKKEAEATIEATNLTINDAYFDWFGSITATASNSDFEEIYFSLTPDASATSYAGTYTIGVDASGDLTPAEEETYIQFYSGSVTLSQAADGSYTLTGVVLAYNNTEYTLNLSYVKPSASSQENISLTNGELKVFDGAWQYMGINNDYFVSVAAYADEVAGEYAFADLAADYTYVVKFVNGDTIWYDAIDADLIVAVSGENATISGTILAQNENDAADVIEFTVALNGAITVDDGSSEYDSEETFNVNFPDYVIIDQYLVAYNVLIVDAENADGAYISVEFNVAAGETAIAPGVYPIDYTYADGTVSGGEIDGNIYGSFAGYLTPEDKIQVPLWLFASGTVTVLENGVIEINAANTKGAPIIARLGEYPEGVENTEAATVPTQQLSLKM